MALLLSLPPLLPLLLGVLPAPRLRATNGHLIQNGALTYGTTYGTPMEPPMEPMRLLLAGKICRLTVRACAADAAAAAGAGVGEIGRAHV